MKTFLFVILILSAGASLGWFYAWYFSVRHLKDQNRSLRKIEIEEIMIGNGSIMARTSEWPIDGAEYFYNTVSNEAFAGTLTEERYIHHLNTFAAHMTSRQKRGFMKMLKQTRSTEEILKNLNI